MKSAIKAALIFCICPVATFAQEGRQIRLDANTCKNIMPEYQRKKNNPLYAKALAAKQAGKANGQQLKRIFEVEFLHDTLRFAKCKGV